MYAATAAELLGGCVPAVHPQLLGVPPPSPLSLAVPGLAQPVPPAADPHATASAFGDLQSLASHLAGSAHVVFPAMPAGSPLYGALHEALEAAGVPVVGSSASAADAVQDRIG